MFACTVCMHVCMHVYMHLYILKVSHNLFPPRFVPVFLDFMGLFIFRLRKVWVKITRH